MNEAYTVQKNGEAYAVIFPASIGVENGVRFITQDEHPLQVGIFERKKDYEVKAHRHNPRSLELKHVGEFLWVQNGSATVKIFDEEWNVMEEREVRAGDCIVFLRGGHALTMKEDTRILEVKQGPYAGRDAEKVFRSE